METEDEEPEDLEWDPRDPDNIFVDFEEAWKAWSLCQAFQWRHLPKAGGLDDQEEWFLHDAAIIARRHNQLKAAARRNKKRKEEAKKKLGLKKARDRWLGGKRKR